MLKRSLKILAWLFGVLSLIFGITFALLYFRQDQIRDLVFASINENLNSEISVREAGISLRKFPNAAIRLQDVHAAGSHQIGDSLFYLEDLFVEFRIWDMFGSEIPISKLSLENGNLNLLQKGERNNWSIFKDSSGESETAIKLESIALKNISYRYQDESTGIKGFINSLNAQGNFGGSNWDLSLNWQSQAEAFTVEEENYLKSEIVFDGEGQMTGGDRFNFAAEKVRLGTINELEAFFELGEEGLLRISHEKFDLQELQNIYAILGIEWPEDLSLQGESELRIDLIIRDNQDLRTEVFASLQNLSLQSPWYTDEDLVAQVEYYRQGKFDRLEIRELRNSGGSRAIRGTVRQLTSPQLNLHLSLSEDYDYWAANLHEDWQVNSGNLKADLDLRGQFKDWQSLAGSELANARLEGKLDFTDLSLEDADGNTYSISNAKTRFAQNKLYLDTLLIQKEKSDLRLQGQIDQPLRFISDSTSLLTARMVIESENFDLNDFLSESEDSEEGSMGLAWKERLNLQSLFHLHNFQFRNFQAKELKGQLELNKGFILGDRISLIADEGRYTGNFSIHTPKDSSYYFKAKLQAQRVRVASVFRSFDNFDQETITADNLDGILSVDAQISAPMSPALNLDPQGLEVLSKMTIEEGHLRNYEPMQELSRFAEVEELKDVQFNTLTNTITISKGQIQIPEMSISSNVLNMELSGTHDFENQIDYIITMRLGDVLFAKRDKSSENSEFEEHLAIQKRDDDHRIPIRISGSVDDPKISIDRESMGKSLKESLKQQGQEIRDLFKKEEKKEEQGTGLKFEWDEG
jgi:hypothetical protein